MEETRRALCSGHDATRPPLKKMAPSHIYTALLESPTMKIPNTKENTKLE